MDEMVPIPTTLTRPLADANSFGNIEAEFDDLLDDCFQEHESFLKVDRLEKFLVLGRKGSGKSAICRRLLASEKSNRFSVSCDLEDYPWPHHSSQGTMNVPEERRYLQSWKYQMLLALGKMLIHQPSACINDGSIGPSLRHIRQMLDDSGASDTNIFSPRSVLNLKGGVSAPGAHVSIEEQAMRDSPRDYANSNAVLLDAVFCCLRPDAEYLLCFDRIDQSFAPDKPKYHDALVGLLLAARDLMRESSARGLAVRAVIFLRSDIYATLNFEDKNKITQNATLVRWGDLGSGTYTLRSLMERRFSLVLGRTEGQRVAWAQVFDESKPISRQQLKYSYICDRTLLRPRDIIKYCNLTLEQLKLRPVPTERFDNGAVLGAREEYSQHLFNEYEDEIFKHMPEYRKYFNAIRRIGRNQFHAGDFESQLRQLRVSEPVTDVLEGLFQFSIIGYLRPGGGRRRRAMEAHKPGAEWVWAHKEPDGVSLDERALLKLHPGLQDYLRVKSDLDARSDEIDKWGQEEQLPFDAPEDE